MWSKTGSKKVTLVAVFTCLKLYRTTRHYIAVVDCRLLMVESWI